MGALTSFIVLYFVFRQHRKKETLIPAERVKSWIPTYMLISMVLCLALSSFFDPGFTYTAGIICMIFGVVCVIWDIFANKGKLIQGIKSLDWDTTFFLMGIFVIVGAITLTGWIDKISVFLSGLVGQNIFLGFTLLVYMAVVFSAFVDNVPFLAAMIPVAMAMSQDLGINSSLYLFGLLIGASLGGNITPIGASANIVACGLLKKQGYTVNFREFIKIGLPFTLAAVVPAYLFIWFVWK
jgi:Na+/H+ antiporter NhaD/arsenite permease-like protein